MESLVGGMQAMVKVFRRECPKVLNSERTTVHGADGMLMVLQLAMADVNKKGGGEFRVALSDVLMAWKHLLLDRLHLPPPGSARLDNYDLILETYKRFLRRSNTVDLVDVFSMYAQLRLVDADPEEPVSPVQLFEFLSGSGVWELPELSVPSTPSSRSRSVSSQAQVKTAVRRVFCSYLSLLVNSKNDMALAHTLDVPGRCLGRGAFTDLRRAAEEGNTSLFLALTSFVRAVQLGGKGYAPAESDPLRKHVKGLSDFVHFLDNLEEILGETADPSACGSKLVAAIGAAVAKGRSGGDAVLAAAEQTAQELKERICQLQHSQRPSGAAGSPARPKPYAINHATALGGRDTVKLLMALLDQEALAPPCPNQADLLSEDQPLLGGDEANGLLALFRSPKVSTGRSPEPLRSRIQRQRELLKPEAKSGVLRSQFACTYAEEEAALQRVPDLPSSSQVPTCAHPAPKRRNAEESHAAPRAKSSCEHPDRSGAQGAALGQRGGNAPDPAGQGKGCKRKPGDFGQDGGRENEPPQKRPPGGAWARVRPGRKAQTKRKLLAGQGTLTSFFRL